MKRACVIGWPVAHSRSPLIHGYWLKRYGIEGAYERVPVAPENIAAFLSDFPAQGFVGANVTVPHKEAALAAAAHADDIARGIGAANTLWLEDGALHASNTDSYGFLRNLDDLVPGWALPGGVAVVLGAGGAARSVLRGLLDRGFTDIRLVNRTKERADELARFFGPLVHAIAWENRGKALDDAALLVNTTTLGWTACRTSTSTWTACRKTLSSPTSSMCRWRRRCCAGRASVDCAPPTGSACCCIRRCRASRNGSASAPR